MPSEVTLSWLGEAFARDGYICGEEVLVPVYLALKLEKPLLITGAPGVGKTEIAKVLSRVQSTDLIRLQCYEGLDENKALYEWNYQKQLLMIELLRRDCSLEEVRSDLFAEEYLLERPLLKALRHPWRPVLLIDEIDKSDQEFEAFLLEVLSDFQVSIPEMGTIKARQVPVVVLTSNGERELSDGLKRRCLFLYIDYPDVEKETRIIRTKVPEAGEVLARQVAAAVHRIRTELDLRKKPAIAETIDWARALVLMEARVLEPNLVRRTLNLLLKDQEDLATLNQEVGVEELCRQVTSRG
ncbi:AAA family ATPase [Moorella naiadis (nom. illeg.)]|uniref:AAA family ATPase n=1 Tax=Moorella naiadis (nom. illeg.) TaxID=3093670 RepID=UPI003D9C840E